MRKVFEVELGSQSGRYTELSLPAAPYTLLDALKKLRLEEGELPSWEILRTPACGKIFPYLDPDGSLLELNALCQQLAPLDEGQLAIVEGLAKMEHEKDARPIPMSRLIDMVYSTDRCHFVKEATNDYTLGRFCAENGFVPEADDLSDEAFELLDFAKLGREFRQNEGGVFTSGGYVQRHDELRQVYKTLDLTPKKPDYTVLVQTASGGQVKLPTPIGKTMVDEPMVCVDCAVPALTGMTGMTRTWDMLARRLMELEVDGELPKYKAVLEAADCDDVCRALSLADELDQYAFTPQLVEFEDVAKSKLTAALGKEAVELLLPNLNEYRYGQALVEQGGGKLTGYGLVERNDGQQMQITDQEPAAGGMELM